MKKIISALMGIFLVFCFNSIVMANEIKHKKIDYNLDLTYMSKYMWRGINIVDDGVFQPSITANYGNWGFNIWGNMDLTDVNKRSGEFTETDYTLNYSWKNNKISYELGMSNYTFPKATTTNTTEFFGTISFDSFLNPYITLYKDIDLIKGSYLLVGISKKIGIINVNASIGYGSNDYHRGYLGVNKESLSDFNLSISAPLKISKKYNLTTSLNYSSIVNDGLRKGRNNNDNIWGGISWTKEF